jgi:hypothetical protein
MRAALSATNEGRERKPPKVLDHIELRPAANGGAIAEHHFTSYEHKAEPHAFGADEGKELTAHIMEHMKMSAPEAEDETGGGIADKKGGGAEADREAKV